MNKFNTHAMPNPGIKLETHKWYAITLTTVPDLLPAHSMGLMK